MSIPIRSVLGPITAFLGCLVAVTLARANTVEYFTANIPLSWVTPAQVDLDADGVFDFTATLDDIVGDSSGFNVSIAGNNVSRFEPGISIGPSLTYATSGDVILGHWNVSGGYFGFQFQHDDITVYGWGRIDLVAPLASITGWAFDASGASILTGATVSTVPETSTYAALFGACALSLALWRKRRAVRQAAPPVSSGVKA